MIVRNALGASAPVRPAEAAASLNQRIAFISEIACLSTSSRARQAAQYRRLLRSPLDELATKRARGSMSPPLASRSNAGVDRGGGASIVASQIGIRGTATSKGDTSQT